MTKSGQVGWKVRECFTLKRRFEREVVFWLRLIVGQSSGAWEKEEKLDCVKL